MNLTFHKESLKDCLEEIKPIWFSHWQETEGYRDGLGFNPDYNLYLEYERIGYFHLFTARHNGKLVGDCGMYVRTSMHSQTKDAREDTIYLQPDYRKGGNGSKFLDFVENHLTHEMGVREITLDIKLSNVRVGKLMERRGYRQRSIQYSKVFEGDNHVFIVAKSAACA